MESRLTDSFPAVGADGKEHTVEVWVEYVSLANLRGETGEVAHLIELWTTTGLQLFRLAKGRYQILGTGEVICSSDPAAP